MDNSFGDLGIAYAARSIVCHRRDYKCQASVFSSFTAKRAAACQMFNARAQSSPHTLNNLKQSVVGKAPDQVHT